MLAEKFIKEIIEQLHEDWISANTALTFDEWVYKFHLLTLGTVTYGVIGEWYGDLDDAARDVL